MTGSRKLTIEIQKNDWQEEYLAQTLFLHFRIPVLACKNDTSPLFPGILQQFDPR